MTTFDPDIYGKEAMEKRQQDRLSGVLNRPLRPVGAQNGGLVRLAARLRPDLFDGHRTMSPPAP
jgi:hypothetical protein